MLNIKKVSSSCFGDIDVLKKKVEKDDVLVVSAPGKLSRDELKVKEQFEKLFLALQSGKDVSIIWKNIKWRYQYLLIKCGVEFDLRPYFKEIESHFNKDVSKDYIMTRGEFLSAIVYSKIFNKKFIDGKDVIRVGDDVLFNTSERLIRRMVGSDCVVSGAVGSTKNGEIKELSSCDYTGALISSALKTKTYTIYTKQKGIYVVPPNLAKYSKSIDNISYDDLITYSQFGCDIIDSNALSLLASKGQTLNVENIENNFYTTVVSNKESNKAIKAIGGRENCFIVYGVDKYSKQRIIETLNSFGYKLNFESNNNCYFNSDIKDNYVDFNLLENKLTDISNSIKVRSAKEIGIITSFSDNKMLYVKIMEILSSYGYILKDSYFDKNKIVIVTDCKNFKPIYNILFHLMYERKNSALFEFAN